MIIPDAEAAKFPGNRSVSDEPRTGDPTALNVRA